MKKIKVIIVDDVIVKYNKNLIQEGFESNNGILYETEKEALLGELTTEFGIFHSNNVLHSGGGIAIQDWIRENATYLQSYLIKYTRIITDNE